MESEFYMKYLKIFIDPIRIKGCADDEDTLKEDVYERLQAMLEAETITFYIDEDESEDDEDY